jgi:hypothetical protein
LTIVAFLLFGLMYERRIGPAVAGMHEIPILPVSAQLPA